MALIPKKTFSYGPHVFEAGVPLTPEQEADLDPERRRQLLDQNWLEDSSAVDVNARLDRLEGMFSELLERLSPGAIK